MKRPAVWVIGGVLVLLLALVGGPFVYINFIKDDAPAPLSLDDAPSVTTTTSPGGVAASATGGVDGTWSVATGSTAGYRVQEILFGQKSEAAGRTSKVTGQFVITNTAVTAGSFMVDMASITSDESRRDGQFHGRIMDTSQFPRSTFELTKPIDLGSIPADGSQISTKATGNLTLRGTKKLVTIDVEAERGRRHHSRRRQHPDRLRGLEHPQPERRSCPDRRQRRAGVPPRLHPLSRPRRVT